MRACLRTTTKQQSKSNGKGSSTGVKITSFSTLQKKTDRQWPNRNQKLWIRKTTHFNPRTKNVVITTKKKRTLKFFFFVCRILIRVCKPWDYHNFTFIAYRPLFSFHTFRVVFFKCLFLCVSDRRFISLFRSLSPPNSFFPFLRAASLLRQNYKYSWHSSFSTHSLILVQFLTFRLHFISESLANHFDGNSFGLKIWNSSEKDGTVFNQIDHSYEKWTLSEVSSLRIFFTVFASFFLFLCLCDIVSNWCKKKSD